METQEEMYAEEAALEYWNNAREEDPDLEPRQETCKCNDGFSEPDYNCPYCSGRGFVDVIEIHDVDTGETAYR